MLRGISPLLSPELLNLLYRMGHGDEIVLADAHYPADTCAQRVVRADGLGVVALLDAIMPLFEIDFYVSDPLVLMSPVKGDSLDDALIAAMRASVVRVQPAAADFTFIGRFEFYDRSKQAYAIVQTGETTKYGNIILKKGVTPV